MLRRAQAAFSVLFAASALAFCRLAAGAQAMPDFGSPPSGEFPILFNDHHVYAKPDMDRQGRVLSALVRGKTILVPLRSMFEQMGAEVSYDAATRTAIVSKPGSEIRVTVGKAEAVINGESRPLDVPPEIYQGTVLVPVRLISEAMGAYVEWVPQKHAVAVRYVPVPPPTPAPAPPSPPPPPSPTPAPAISYEPFAATPAPAPTPYHDKYLVVDAIAPQIYNDFVHGNGNQIAYNARGAIELSSPVIHLMFEGNYDRVQFHFPGGPVVPLGGGTSSVVSSFTGHEDDLDVNFGIRMMQPRIYFIEGYFWSGGNYGYPSIYGIGYGLEKLPDLDRPLSFTARFWYSSRVKGPYPSFTAGANTYPGGTVAYRIYSGLLSADVKISNVLFGEVGYKAIRWDGAVSAPGNRNENGPFIGVGVRF